MDVSPVVTRLQERLTGLREIAAAAGLEAAMSGNLAAPAVYVIPLNESALALEHTGAVDELLTQVVGVILVVETRDSTGGEGVTDLAGLRRQVKRALLGWVPDDTTGEPVRFLGGEIVEFANGRLWWSDEYRLINYDRSTQ